MQRRLAFAALLTALQLALPTAAHANSSGDGPIVVSFGDGAIDTTISVPGAPGDGSGGSGAQSAISHSSGAAGVTCTYVLDLASP